MSGDGQFGDQLCVLLRHRVAGGPASRSRVGVGGSFGTGTSNTSQPVEGGGGHGAGRLALLPLLSV